MSRAVYPFGIAGHYQGVGVLVHGDERTNHRQLVPHTRLQWEMLADLHAGHVGGDGFELAAEFFRRVGLEIIHVEVRRTARQVDHDGGLVSDRRDAGRTAGAGRGAETEHLRQRQAGAEGADL